MHWANEAVRLNKAAETSPSALENFDFNRPHFKTLFGNFFVAEGSGRF
jgi:hypothetical protein